MSSSNSMPDATHARALTPDSKVPVHRLTRDHQQKQTPVATPEGRHIVYTRIVGAYISLRVMAADGAGDRPLFTDRDDYIQQHPCFSFDGKHLAFTVNEGYRTGGLAVYACDINGMICSNFRPVTTGGQNCQPAWSPDGKQLAYVGMNHQLSLVNADGSSRKRIGNLPGIQFFPTWSPDGQWIAFASSHETHYQIYRIHPDGTGLRRLTQSEGLDTHPTYSPDGRWIAFSSNREGNYELYVMREDGTEVRNVSQHPARDEYPGWTRDSRGLLFVSTRDGGFDIYRATPEG